MKTITREIIIDFIQNANIELKPTQPNLCLPIINRLYKKMCAGIKFSGIKVSNGLICDGHHRYVASMLAQYPLERILGNLTTATILFTWESINLIEEDWDTAATIKLLNEQDANYNNLPLAKIVELLK